MQDLWDRALDDLRGRLSPESFETWLEPVRYGGLEDDVMILRIPNKFFADWIQSHYLAPMLDAMREQAGTEPIPRTVKWEVDETLRDHVRAVRASEPPKPRRAPSARAARAVRAEPSATLGDGPSSPPPPPDLKPQYTFDSFVVGPSNQLAHAASVAAAAEPGTRFNPLFIYGGAGLGKTHLVNAIGHTLRQRDPNVRIRYVSAEQFTNEFISALQNNAMNEFHQRYRNECDALLMDDVQFLATRVQTQEAFFHTFNALYHLDTQIVVTSDVFPSQIDGLEERLVSRFQSGMVADVQAPELDTRVAILQKKAELEGLDLPADVALFIAEQVRTNVRDLEGMLLRITMKADLLGRPLDLDLARDSLHVVSPTQDTATTVEDVQRAVAAYFSLRVSDLKSGKRQRTVTFPRQLAMYLARQRVGSSYPELGERFGGKDHTTVMSACRKISKLDERGDEKTVDALRAVELKLGL